MIINLGDAPFKAFIKVTYPAGVCICTNGTNTFTHSGGGTHTFTVNGKGTWTVTASYSALKESATVSITTAGETKSVSLKYYIFKEGKGAVVPMSKVQGGNNGAITIGTSSINIVFQHHDWAESTAHSTNSILLTDLKTLCFDMSTGSGWPTTAEWIRGIGVYKNKTNEQHSKNLVAGTSLSKNTARSTRSINISSVSGSYYIGTKGQGAANIYNIWLE